METDELQNIWKNIDSGIQLISPDELKQKLADRTGKTINKFLFIIGVDIVVCIGLIVFLIYTAMNRMEDPIYLLNNFTLGVITLISMIASIYSWNKLHNHSYNLSLKEWLQERIRLLTSWLSGKYSRLYIILIPVLLVLLNLSVHVYHEHKLLTEVLRTEESVYGLLAGFIVGLLVAYYAVSKIRRYQIKNLEFLKELHTRL